MRLISWNIARAGPARIARQVAALATRDPDIVALQEVRVNRAAEYRRALECAGFPYVVDSFSRCIGPFVGCRASGVLVASKWYCAAITETTIERALPWLERLLSVTLNTAWGEIEVHNVYVPVTYGGRDRDVRIATLDGLYDELAAHADTPRILCGDFNLPQAEMPDGTVITFGQTRRKNGAFSVTHAAMDASERKILVGLAPFGLVDVYRQIHGYERQESSWYHLASGKGFRLDHILASPSLGARECRYLDAFRTEQTDAFVGLGFTRLSDHAALEVVFAPEDERE